MEIKNNDLQMLAEFLDKMDLSDNPKASLGRTKFKEVVQSAVKEMSTDQINLLDEYDAWSDKEKGTFNLTSGSDEFKEAYVKFSEAKRTIEFESPFKDDFIEALQPDNYKGDLSGTNADVYAILYTELVEGEDNNEQKD